MAMLDSKDYQKAIDEFQAAIESNPADAAAHDGLGIALAELGRTTEATSEFERAAKLSDGLASAHFHLALAYDRTGQTLPAVYEYETVLRIQPANDDARYALSGACWKLGDREGAIALLRQIVAHNPSFAAEAWYNLGIELRGIGQLDQATAALNSALAHAPDNTAAYLALAQIETERNEFKAAVETVRHALKLAPGDAECHYTMGEALRLSGDLAGAAAEFRRALNINPQSSPAHRQLGIVMRQQSDYAAARSELEQAVAIDPSDAQAFYYLGSVLLKANDTDGAIAELTRAVDLNAYDSASHVVLATALAKAGRTAESAEQRGQAQALDELAANAGQSRVLLDTAVQHLDQGETDAALSELRQATKLSPEYPEAQTQLARALLRKGSHDAEAVDVLRRAIQLKDDPQAHLQLGLALEKTGQKSEALGEFQRATELAPSLFEAHREIIKAALTARDWKAVLAESTAILAWNSTDSQAGRNYMMARREIRHH